MSILTSHMMVTKNPHNVHRKCFWTILVTFIFDVKIDVNMCEPHYVNLFFLWTSSIVCVFDFLTFDIFLTFWHLLDILTSFWHFDIFLNLNHLGLSQGHFFTEEGSYQGLKDATLIGLLSDKSAEKLKGKYLNFRQILHTGRFGHFRPSWAWLKLTREWHHFWSENSMWKACMENFQIIKYFDPNMLALLSDNRAIEVASCRYW